ncbi:MAG TPA: 4-alpha-glucanotransferase, partial [Steroidobacteraceae bacterium]
RTPAAIAQSRLQLSVEIDKVCFGQFLLFRQANQLKHYAHAQGIGLIGDMPFFVSPDSSDVWTDPQFFLLDEQRQPRFVAGVPPDYFSAEGQRWGNPVFDWQRLCEGGYDWCIRRLRTLLAHVDTIRLDHFRGFAAAWHIPAGKLSARAGAWVSGPGADFFAKARQALGGLPFIAEDLGLITSDVRALRDKFHLPGTKVLQFAFDGHPDNPYLPEHYPTDSVAYTATHDNDTTRGWFESLQPNQRELVWNYLQRKPDENCDITVELIRLAWSSVAALAIAPLQDVLNLGTDARMNSPGRVDGNWRWRRTPDLLIATPFDRLRELTATTHRHEPSGLATTGSPAP